MTREQLRVLVDAVWNEATESTTVPSTKWADAIIDKWAHNLVQEKDRNVQQANNVASLGWADRHRIGCVLDYLYKRQSNNETEKNYFFRLVEKAERYDTIKEALA